MSHTNPLPMLPDVQAFQNTDREVWRETPGDFYSNSVHLTATGGLGINVGGTVYVKPPAEWHRLASGARSTAAQPLTLSHEEIDRVFNEHEEAPQISYRYWVANALLAAANEKSPTAAAQPPGWVDEAAGQIEHLDRENNRLAREAWTWSKACEAATRKLHILSTHHPRLEVRYWTGSYWEPMYGVALDRLLETLAPAPPAATGDSTPPSASVQGDSTERSGEKPEAVDRERGVR